MDPEGAEEGLAQLVLTIIELLRQLVERQALRRVDGGNLTEEEIEKLGLALMNLDVKMDELKEIFNLTDEDLNIDLGPLGNLL
nr:gas vesicle protein K [Oceanobacillus saliphilus]